MNRWLRRLLSIDEFTVYSRFSVEDCRELLAARLLSVNECRVRAGSRFDDGRPLFFGTVTDGGFDLGQYRALGERRGYRYYPDPQTHGIFEPADGGTRVYVRLNDQRSRTVGFLVRVLLLAALLLGAGVLAQTGFSAWGLVAIVAIMLGYGTVRMLYIRDDPAAVRDLLTRALQGTIISSGTDAAVAAGKPVG